MFDMSSIETEAFSFPKLNHLSGIFETEIILNFTEIDDVLKTLVLQSNEVQFLRSFAHPALKTKLAPLSPFWRYVKERGIEDDVQRRYGLQPDDILHTGTPAWREYHTRVHALDDEQIPSMEVDQREPLVRLKKYFEPYVERAAVAMGHGNSLIKINSHKNENNSFTEVEMEGSVYRGIALANLTDKVSADFRERFGKHPSRADRVYQLFIQLFVDRLFSDEYESLDQLISDCASRTANMIRLRLFEAHFTMNMPDGANDGLLNELLRGGKNDEAFLSFYDYASELLATSFSSYPRWKNNNSSNVVSTSSSSNAPLDGQLVQARKPRKLGGRIGIPAVRQITSEKNIADQLTDATIELEQPFPHATFELLGYTAIKHAMTGDKIQVRYAHNAENDPYETCTVPVDANRLADLCDVYESIGLVHTVQAIRKLTTVTVKDLVEILSMTSVYEEAGENSMTSIFAKIKYFEDFKTQIKDGRLCYQCTGAAAFLGMSLEELFPNYRSTRIDGYTIPTTVGAEGFMPHAQVVFTHEGKKYILDATPAVSNDGRVDRRFRFRDLLSLFRRAESAHDNRTESEEIEKATQTEETLDIFEEIKKTTPQIKVETGDETKANAQKRVESILQVILDTSKKDLYKTIARLSKRDPLRQAIAASRIPIDDPTYSTRLTSTIEQLEKYKDIPAKLRDKHQFGHYASDIIEQLQRELGRLLQLKSS